MLWISLASFVSGAIFGQMRSAMLLVVASFVSVALAVSFAVASGSSIGIVGLFTIGNLIICQIAFVVSAYFSIPHLRNAERATVVRRRLS